MRKEYILKNIVHSGRKGIRNEPVKDSKYDGLIGARLYWDIDEVKQFKTTRFVIPESEVWCPYDWWETSEVLELSIDTRTNEVFLETANSIYILQEVSKCFQIE